MSQQQIDWLAQRGMQLTPGAAGQGYAVRTVPLSEMPRSGPSQQQAEITGAIVVLEPVVKPKPVVPKPVDVYPPSIIPAFIEGPTASLVGTHEHGGAGMPWTSGPGGITALDMAIGSLLFYIGAGVAISVGLGSSGAELMGQVKRSYHRRGVSMRVHTGIGRKGDVGGEWEREEPLPVPYNAPLPPGANAPAKSLPAPTNGHEPGWLGAPGLHDEQWGPFLGVPGLPPGPSLHETFEFFEWVAPWAIEFGSWLTR